MGGDARRRSVGDRVIPIPGELRSRLVANGMRTRVGEAHDPYPVVRLFTPDAAASWLLTELDPDDPDLAYGLCDPGLGAPKLDHLRLSLLTDMAGGSRPRVSVFVACPSFTSLLSRTKNNCQR